ncbi:RNA-binding protein [Indibacter alkaliphilus LW1]|jgi:predicted RNA-binding protein with PUA-like domain|uniref:RNA-binding protein n=1 Tax=Indibacter alkaliphilus (strain CCUG 57479 / KCTC 22604 / LW1) TaxID=1189612 RepID=S2DKP4_INDAL|nr:EVE domain-containing protein [Indibacter alkaliphilus]EOZ99654.1 RNA-binding protein [Indibacter alkaliphilus LW1]
MNYWLVKSEPGEYSYQDLENDKDIVWDGIRNYQARNYLKEMKVGDQVLYYHSGKDKAIVGLAEVSEEAFPDKNDKENKGWVAVRLAAKKAFDQSLNLEQIKNDPKLTELPLLKQSRLSVMPIEKSAFDHIIKSIS